MAWCFALCNFREIFFPTGPKLFYLASYTLKKTEKRLQKKDSALLLWSEPKLLSGFCFLMVRSHSRLCENSRLGENSEMPPATKGLKFRKNIRNMEKIPIFSFWCEHSQGYYAKTDYTLKIYLKIVGVNCVIVFLLLHHLQRVKLTWKNFTQKRPFWKLQILKKKLNKNKNRYYHIF